jgi:hypothetical protein
MPTLDEINGVSVRTPIRMNLDAYAQALNKIDQRDLQARQLVSEMNAGLANVKANLNEADYDWFDEYVNNINDQINQAASFGDYAMALNKATELGSTYGQDSELLARIQANQDYKKFVNEVEQKASKGEISPLRKQRLLAENPYSFNGIYSDNGVYLSRDTNNYPAILEDIDLSAVAKEAANRVHEKVDNNFVYDPETGISFTEQLAQKREQAIREDFNDIIANHPEYYKAIEEEMDDMRYQIRKWEEEQAQYPENSEEYKRLDDFINTMREDLADGTVEGVFAKRAGNTIRNASYSVQKTNIRKIGKSGGSGANKPTTDLMKYYSEAGGSSVLTRINENNNFTGYLTNEFTISKKADDINSRLVEASQK